MAITESNKIEIMGQLSGAASFTCNNAVDKVPLTVGGGVLWSGTKKSVFKNGDAFTLLSLGFTAPLGFEFYNVSDSNNFLQSIEFGLVPVGNEVYIGNEPLDKVFLPFASYELANGTYYKNSAFTGQNYRIFAKFSTDGTPEISMLNVPNSLNGKTFLMPIFMKIQHTESLWVPL